jgi:hypothetical protein
MAMGKRKRRARQRAMWVLWPHSQRVMPAGSLPSYTYTYRQVPLKAGLIVTLCKHLDWTLPADVTMPLRKMVNKKLQWLERVGTGDYQIHQIGESKLAKLKN